MRMNLKLFRISRNLTQEQFGKKTGVTRAVYSNIERGRNDAPPKYWATLQKVFGIPDEQMYTLIKETDVSE